MIHSPITMIDQSNTTGRQSDRPLNARSLALSLLLGTHPPQLPVASLVGAAKLFGVSERAMRTALSRMASAGEVVASDGWYRLAGRMIERQATQDLGRRAPTGSWDGSWISVTPSRSSRGLAERRDLRRRLSSLRLGELRPDYWLRPANVETDGVVEVGREFDLIVMTGALSGVDDREMVAALWPLEELNRRAEELVRRMRRLRATQSKTPTDWLAPAFAGAAEVVRFLTVEPKLPGTVASTAVARHRSSIRL